MAHAVLVSSYCSECVVTWGQTDEGQCPTCGAETVPSSPKLAAASRLERIETAHMAARLCWLWPDDEEQRAVAIQACAAIDIDYIGALAEMMDDSTASAHAVRRAFAEALRKAADRIYAADGRSAA
jgi:hypothetical protein